MYGNYLKIALRNLSKYKVYSSINILGLMLGLTAGLLLTIYIVDEFTFDRFHEKSDRIYRLIPSIEFPGQPVQYIDVAPGALMPTLAQDFAEIESYAQLAVLGRADITYENNAFYESFLIADANLFDIFDFNFQQGDKISSFANPNSVVMTEDAASKYFGSEDPMGKTLQSNRGEFIVSGVLENIPTNSHLQFNLIFSMPGGFQEQAQNWDNFGISSYFLLNENSSIEQLESKFAEFIQDKVPTEISEIMGLTVQPLEEIHFDSAEIQNSLSDNMGSINTIYTLTGIVFFILFIACINYINLATARSVNRSNEIGLRKVVGAEKKQLILQFLTESILLTGLAFVLAIAATQMLLPWFNGFTGKSLSFANILQPSIAYSILAVGLLVGIGAGTYPAFYLANIKTIGVLKGKQAASKASLLLRRSLVVTQFCLSVVLLVATLIAIQQMNFIRNKPLGFEAESVVVVDINSGFSRNGYEAIKNEFLSSPNVHSVSVSTRVPGEWKDMIELGARLPGQDSTQSLRSTFIGADSDFLETFSIELLSGRNFLPGQSDLNNVLINQSMARRMNWDENQSLGKSVLLSDNETEYYSATVTGVIPDFHFRSLHEEIGPLIIGHSHTEIQSIDYFSARISSADVSETLQHLQASQAIHDADTPFEYHFLDEEIKNFYETDELTTSLFSIAAAIAVFIATLGLYGLSAFATEQRTKEIGIRKVLGATVAQLLRLLSLDFIKLVIIANVIAWPAVYYLMTIWLDGFAYHEGIGLTNFVLAAMFLVLITLITVSAHTTRLALENPIKSIRYE